MILRRQYLLISILNFLWLFSCELEKSEDKVKLTSGTPILVGPAEFNSSFSYYNTSPESPDGSLITYVKFLTTPQNDRHELLKGELWICQSDLTGHRKICEVQNFSAHNGVRAQWLTNKTIVYQDDSIRVVNLEGDHLIKALAGRIGHETHEQKFLFSHPDPTTKLSSIYEYDVPNQAMQKIGDVADFQGLTNHYFDDQFTDNPNWRILHLQYSPDGSKIAFRMDVGPRDEKYKYLVTMDKDVKNIHCFGPKPMHFAWFDNQHIMGHDNQVDDGMPNDKSLRSWDQQGNFHRTLAGPGNHLGASPDREYFASESWYREMPVILRAFKKGSNTPFWQDTVSTDSITTWVMAYHTNPSFSRDGKRVYFNKCVAPGKVQAYMAILPEK